MILSALLAAPAGPPRSRRFRPAISARAEAMAVRPRGQPIRARAARPMAPWQYRGDIATPSPSEARPICAGLPKPFSVLGGRPNPPLGLLLSDCRLRRFPVGPFPRPRAGRRRRARIRASASLAPAPPPRPVRPARRRCPAAACIEGSVFRPQPAGLVQGSERRLCWAGDSGTRRPSAARGAWARRPGRATTRGRRPVRGGAGRPPGTKKLLSAFEGTTRRSG